MVPASSSLCDVGFLSYHSHSSSLLNLHNHYQLGMKASPHEEAPGQYQDDTERPQSSPIISTILDHHLTHKLDWNLFLLFVNGGLCVCWGAALVVFSTGIVEIYWGISQFGQLHPAVANFGLVVIATASTAHLRFTLQNTVKCYISSLLHSGFTIQQLLQLQGIMGLDPLTPFKWKWRVMWGIIYLGMALHTASVSSILQPVPWYDHIKSGAWIPCGVDPASLTLEPLDIPEQIGTTMNQTGFMLGMQLGLYYVTQLSPADQIMANTTTGVPGRGYVKDNYGYSIVGYYSEGLQEVPAVEITAQCSLDQNDPSLLSMWTATFPGRSLPSVLIVNGTGVFDDPGIFSPVQTVITSTSPFNLTGSSQAMYAIINASGSGGIIAVDATGSIIGCTWDTVPRLLHVETIAFTARTLYANNASTVPSPLGHAVCSVTQGMAHVMSLGLTRLDQPEGLSSSMTAQILQTLIADGVKAATTIFTTYCTSDDQSCPSVARCDSDNRSVLPHWRFGNEHNLGWIAIIWSLGVGLTALVAVFYLQNKLRMDKIQPLKVNHAFLLGMENAIVDFKGVEQQLLIRDQRVIAKASDWISDEESIPLQESYVT
ncbi:hypothetical protein C8J56DRAFT_1027766 [Mycena floridula]|nr:hypothetical protein C8J56DRAFT_1027766 [Mycena floridula]